MSASLTPVSFKKGRAHAPRLSPKYEPGKHSERFWTEAEDQILKDHYPTKGHPYCASRLENRSKLSIYQRAQKLGLKFEKGQKSVRRHDWTQLDADILRLWPDLKMMPGSTSGAKTLAKMLGKPHWMISGRLRKLGLTIAHTKEPPWTPAEDALLLHVPRHDVEKASEIFAAHGFRRTPTAIMVRCKRVGISRRYKDTFSATTAATILGMDCKTVSEMCNDGTIKAGRRSSKRLPQQGGAPHSITAEALRQFIIDHIGRIDFRRVDKFGIVSILTSTPNQGEKEKP